MRQEGVKVEVEITGRGVGKALSHASQAGIKYAVIVGERELESGAATVKDLEAGSQSSVGFEKLPDYFKSKLNSM